MYASRPPQLFSEPNARLAQRAFENAQLELGLPTTTTYYSPVEPHTPFCAIDGNCVSFDSAVTDKDCPLLDMTALT